VVVHRLLNRGGWDGRRDASGLYDPPAIRFAGSLGQDERRRLKLTERFLDPVGRRCP
jgi:hypothetical protein